MQNNPEIQQVVDAAVNIAREKHHEYVLTEHLQLAMIRYEPFRQVLEKFGTDVAQFDQEVDAYLTSLQSLIKPGDVSPRKTNALDRMFNRALTQVLFTGRRSVTMLDLYLSIMGESNSHAHYFFLKYGVKKEEFVDFCQRNYASPGAKISNEQATEILEEHCLNLTRLAREDRLEPMIGRSAELDEMITVLARRFKANVLMVGDPGVGKTAIIEGLAQEIHAGRVCLSS